MRDAQATGRGKHTWEHEGSDEDEWQAPGKAGVGGGGVDEQTQGPVGEELPAIMTYFSERERKRGGKRWRR